MQPYMFMGRPHDLETDFLNVRHRYYSPDLGRFISRDTIGIWGDEYNLGNPYAFLGNGPTYGCDPYGDKRCGWFCRNEKQLRCLGTALGVGALTTVFVAATWGFGAAFLPVIWAGMMSAGSLSAAVGGAITFMIAGMAPAFVVALIQGFITAAWSFVGCVMAFPFMGKVVSPV